MTSSSFVQASFLGGEWSPTAQGRVTDPKYKTGMSLCLNAQPLEEGAWVRRPGSRFLGLTRAGAAAVLRDFDFTITQPYQLEFTDSFLRFWAGLALVTTDDGNIFVDTISTASPAQVYITSAIPSHWAAGDFVVFDLVNSPCSGPLLCGRQFKIGTVDTATNSFTLLDPVTGDDIDGSAIAYVQGASLDKVRKVFELATQYAAADLASIRTVQDESTVLLLRATKKPYTVSEGTTPYPFAIAAQDFEDGPWLDINDTATTLTPSGTTGSITVSASAATGINGGLGFQSTDVGRLIRLQGGPAQWNSGTTYAKNAKVTGSDSNVYSSIAGANINHDPTTDDGTHWLLSATVVTWTWMKITAVGANTSVTATIMGADLPEATGTTTWRLGAFSDTTDWPTCGCYHEGRLWLSGCVPNRVDASKSNDHFNFSPTDTDGTVADDNAISATINATEANAIFWLLSTEDGVIAGAQAGEWRFKASVLDDPITPTSIQARRISTYGCANIDPIQPGNQTVFVQRQKRKLLGHYQVSANRYKADNISRDFAHLMTPSVAEIRWQQEPALTMWVRRDDGSLTGVTYQKSENNERASFEGAHEHTLGSNREVTSISTGPRFDGLSEALYFVSNQTDEDEPDFGVHWVESLMPIYDASANDCDAFHVDGGAVPCCTELLGTSPDFTGLRVYGLWHLNGKTIQPFFGGLDLGDYTVANGYIDITFGDTNKGHDAALFTLAFFQSLSTCDLFGVEGVGTANSIVTPPYSGSLMALVNDTADVDYDTLGDIQAVDHNNQIVFQYGNDTDTCGLMKLNGAVPGTEILGATNLSLFGAGNALNESGFCYSSGYIYGRGPGLTNFHPVQKIRTSDMTLYESYGTNGSFGTTTDGYIRACSQLCGVVANQKRWLVSVGQVSAFVVNEIDVLFTENNPTVLAYAYAIDETAARVCAGPQKDNGSFFVVGRPHASMDTGDISLYQYWIASDGPVVYLGDGEALQQNNSFVTRRKFATYSPSDIDATWTHWEPGYPAYDQADGNIIVFFSTTDAVTNKYRLVKFDTLSGAILWNTALSDGANFDVDMPQCNLKGSLDYMVTNSGLHYTRHIDLSDGTTTTTAINNGFAFHSSQVFDFLSGSIIFNGPYAESTGPVPTYIGDYLPLNGDAIPNHMWGRYFTGEPYTEQTVTEYPFYGSIGFTYTSRGQLLRPDYGVDAGAQNGPAFGKKRRTHWFSAALYRTRGISIGTDFSRLRPVKLQTAGGTAIAAPTLYSATASDTITDDYSFEGKIAWEISRPYPAMVTAMAGYLMTMDK